MKNDFFSFLTVLYFRRGFLTRPVTTKNKKNEKKWTRVVFLLRIPRKVEHVARKVESNSKVEKHTFCMIRGGNTGGSAKNVRNFAFILYIVVSHSISVKV